MLENVHSSLKALENSFMLSYREVCTETKNVQHALDKLDIAKNQLPKDQVLEIAKILEKLSIKNEYKLNLIKDFPEYFSSIKLKKK